MDSARSMRIRMSPLPMVLLENSVLEITSVEQFHFPSTANVKHLKEIKK